jgi:hypothetical protein
MSVSVGQRQSCSTKLCFATFSATAGNEGETRHCNRAGPEGGHAHQWDGRTWQVVDGKMQHDRG